MIVVPTRVIANAARVGYEESRAIYTWRTWLFGMTLRMATQVLFFALFGLLVDSSELITFAFVGNVVAVTALMGLAIGPDTAGERWAGTMPLLVAAPRSLIPVMTGRNLFHLADGVGQSLVIFAILAVPLGLDPSWHWMWLPLGLTIVWFGSYGLGLFLAGWSVRRPQWGNTLFNIVFWTLVAICGVNVRNDVFPQWVQTLADFLPLTHGLEATRLALTGAIDGILVREAALEIAIGAAWVLLAVMTLRVFEDSSRRAGTIDLIE